MDMKKVAKELEAVAGLLTAEPKEMFVILVDYIWMDVAEDTYEQGEIGRRMTVLNEKNQGSFSSIKDVVAHASRLTGIPEKNFAIFSGDEGRIEGQGMVDENNNYVGDDKRFQERFKAGEVKAWNADVSVHVRFAKTWTPSAQEIKKISSLQVE